MARGSVKQLQIDACWFQSPMSLRSTLECWGARMCKDHGNDVRLSDTPQLFLRCDVFFSKSNNIARCAESRAVHTKETGRRPENL